jgi:hypothetical protein
MKNLILILAIVFSFSCKKSSKSSQSPTTASNVVWCMWKTNGSQKAFYKCMNDGEDYRQECV